MTLYHNVRIMHVQVDLVMRRPVKASAPGLLTLVEVKSQNPRQMGHLSRSQKNRLFRVAQHLALWEPVELILALLEPSQKLQLLPVDALTAR
jgi:hypothetical protein